MPFQKGNKLGKKFQKGHKPYLSWLGKKHTEESNEKNRQAHLGKKASKETKAKQSLSAKRVLHTEEWNKNVSKALKGGKSSWWIDGRHSLNDPYSADWTCPLRLTIRERDKYLCQLCGEKQGDRAHAVHHIDYDKDNCNPNNLITLCNKCHSKTNVNRKKWEKYFKSNGRC